MADGAYFEHAYLGACLSHRLEVRAIGHLTTIVAGLWQAPGIIAMARPGLG